MVQILDLKVLILSNYFTLFTGKKSSMINENWENLFKIKNNKLTLKEITEIKVKFQNIKWLRWQICNDKVNT